MHKKSKSPNRIVLGLNKELLRTLCSLAVVAAFGISMLGSAVDPWAGTDDDYAEEPLFTVLFAPPEDYAATSSEPALEFSGNQTVIAPPAGSGAGVGLRRQSDCSITEYYATSSATSTYTSGTFTLNPVANYQSFLHSAAGLTTTAGTWSNGCADQELGVPSRYGVYLGMTKDGASAIGAYIDYNNDLYVGSVNLTTGTYSATELLTANAGAVLAADLNGDGYPDLIVETLSSTAPIAVYLNNGDGTFAYQTSSTSILSGMSPGALTADDMNGDGKIDLMAAAGNQLIFLPGNGDGTFGAPVTTPVSFSSSTQAAQYIATGDFTGNGKKDLILSNGYVFLGNGDGTFTAAASPIVLAGSSSGLSAEGFPVVGDWNNDGKLDVAFVSIGSPAVLTVYLGNGDGTFTEGNSYAVMYGLQYVSAADLDGDGNLDLILGEGNGGSYGPDYNSAGFMQVLMGRGDGSFAGAQVYLNGHLSIGGNLGPQSFATADFHGKGFVDVLGVSGSGLEMLTGNGSGAFTTSTAISTSGVYAVTAADMNGDGKTDAVFVEYSSSGNEVAVALGNGDGTFQPATTTLLPATTGTGETLTVGDFNGDGKPDVIVTEGAAVYLLPNQGNGQLGAPALIDTEANPVQGAAAADLRGNGKMDLVLAESTPILPSSAGAVNVLLGNGDGTFQPDVSYSVNYSPLAIAIGDMNNDGKPDLVVASANSAYTATNLYVLPGKGDGSFGTAVTSSLPEAYITSLAIADFNGDGNPDVVAGACCGSTFTTVAYGNGTGAFPTIYGLPLGASTVSVVGVDVNGDNKPDLLFESAGTPAALEVVLNQSIATAAPQPTTTTLTASATSVGAGASVTFTATVAPSSGSGTPTGTVTFYDGATTLGSETLSAGSAAFTTSSLAVGTHSITASYSGDSNNAASTSSAVSVAINALDFSLAVSGSSTQTASAGGTASYSLAVAPLYGNYPGTVTFTVAGMPSGATSTFSPSSITATGGAQTVGLTVSIPATAAANRSRPRNGFPPATLALLLLPLAGLMRRRGRGLVRFACLLLIALAGMAASTALSACGGGGSQGQSTQTYAATVTAASGSVQHTVNITLNVN